MEGIPQEITKRNTTKAEVLIELRPFSLREIRFLSAGDDVLLDRFCADLVMQAKSYFDQAVIDFLGLS